MSAMTMRAGRGVESRLASRCAAIASAGAAAIHLGAAPAHWQHWVLSGVFFASIGLLKLIWVFLVWSRPTALVLAIGIAANVGSVVLWLQSRIAGVPFGPAVGHPEAVDAAGICVLLLQSYVIMGATWALVRRSRAQQVSPLGSAVILLGANAVMVVAVTVGLASSIYGHDADHHGPAEAREVAVTGPAPSAVPASPGLPVVESALVTDGHHDHAY